MQIRDAIIPAAGNNKRLEGLRLTRLLPKSMIPIVGKPVLEYIVRFLVNNGIRNVYIIVNNKKESIMSYFGDGTDFGISIDYIVQENPNGIATAIDLAKDFVKGNFICILGDTFVVKQNISNMIETSYDKKAVAVQALTAESDVWRIKQSCNVVIDDMNRIIDIIEKPQNVQNNIRGSGIYVFNQEIFDYISRTVKTSTRGEVEITDTIKLVAQSGRAYGEWLRPGDININVINDIVLATQMALQEVENVSKPKQ
jgi:dTDP-glucose pyrophosphorylase